MRFLRFSLCSALLLILNHCQSQTPVRSVVHNKQKTTFLLDSTQAANVILEDRYDHFFERVTATEMSIQMKRALAPGAKREEVLPYFRGYLQADMANFSPEESKYVADVMRDVFETCSRVAPDMFPDSLLLLKTHGKHYGDGVYYTRANCIIIPADVLRRRDRSAFKSTMYHEVFHVYSRLHPEKRAELYRLIGFNTLGYDQLTLPPALAAQVLHNPDGVDFAQRIALTTPEGTIHAVPIIYSTLPGYVSDKKEFFSYLEFELFEIKQQPDGKWLAITKPNGLSSTLNMNQVPDFFRQIRDNTTYIIHPDEVLADNFSFIMLDLDGKQASGKFSKEGKALLRDITAVLKK
jgi:hypothetical protein